MLRKIRKLLRKSPAAQARDREKYRLKYFSRTRRFDIRDNSVVLMEAEGNKYTSLDTWTEIVIASADGQKTVQELIDLVRTEFPKQPPQEFEQALLRLIDQLLLMNYLELSNRPSSLPYYLDRPVSQQNAAKATAAMRADGFISDGN